MNSKFKLLIVLSLIFMMGTLQVQAEKYKGPIVKTKAPKASADCLAPARNTELSLNLVRAFLKTNGTMWFKEIAEYEVPKGSGKTSMFSAALWIGGQDDAEQLYVAAMTFGQRGNDFWTGPLKMKDGSIDQPTCSRYDRFFPISRVEVERHIRAQIENDPEYVIPQSILEWPGNGVDGESMYLAPYKTWGGNDPTVYRPQLGDYPYYDFENELCPWTDVNRERAKELPWSESADGTNPSPTGRYQNSKALPMPPERIWTRQQQDFEYRDNMMIYADHVLKGDETIFWFLNDRGGAHTESRSNRSIGLEIRVQAFAFATNDELNKMTFYSYEIINRGRNTLRNTYFSQWVDPDLGYAQDDYVGCDVNRGMGYCYNGVEIDGTGQFWAYGSNPPAVGVDFFQGPYIDPDGSDNPKFHKELADATGSETQREYCRLFVDYLFEQWPIDQYPNGPKDLSEPHPTKTIEITNHDGTKDTMPIRYNNQFAINGVNFGDGIVDNERFGMRRFVYHNNSSSEIGDPGNAVEFYNLLRGIWKNGQRMTYGGNGFDNKNTAECDFMFPRGTDYCNWGTRGVQPGAIYGNGGRTGTWSEEDPNGTGSKRNSPDDRRFMQSAGPFTLKQGACNYITVGIPWARATQGGVQASISLLIIADDRCQALFENCFKVLDGPDAPNLTIREYDQKLILLLSNSAAGNNELEDYEEMDPTIPELRIDVIQHRIDSMKITISDSLIVSIGGIDTVIFFTKDTVIYFGGDTTVFSTTFDTIFYDRYYRFEGYQIFQVAGPEVGANDLDNPSLARIIRQYDVVNFDKNGRPVGRLINWEFDESLQVPVPREKVDGANLGIEHSFEVIQDAFATGNRQLVNYKTYYFIAIAYAYNEYAPFFIDDSSPIGLVGQKLPYLRGRKTAEGRSVTAIPAIPHPPSVHGGGLTLNSDYGSIPNIIRVDGQGNGGVPLELTKETIDYIVKGGDKDAAGNSTFRAAELKYEKNAGPLNVKVIDPLRVKPYDYTIIIRDSVINNATTDLSNDAYWILSIDPTVSDEELIEAGLIDNYGNAMRVFTSQTSIGQHNEQIIFPLGISVGITNIDFVNTQPEIIAIWGRIMGDTLGIVKYNDYKAKLHYAQSRKIDPPQGDVIFERPNSQWITGLMSASVDVPSNWIRAGNRDKGKWEDPAAYAGNPPVKNEYERWRLEDAFFITNRLSFRVDQQTGAPNWIQDRAFKDYTGEFRTLCNGTWAPYVLASPYDGGPQAKYVNPDENTFPRPGPGTTTIQAQEPLPAYYSFQDIQLPTRQPGYNQTMTNLYSVDIVLTPDRDKWTRCVVLESCSDRTKAEGGALKNEPRKAISVDKDGNPTPDATDGFGPTGNQGMGWFPGYAVNLETGERLNIMFGENSDTTLAKYGNLINGNDMIFNPTYVYALATKDVDTLDIPFIRAGTPIPQWQYDMLFEFVQINQRVRLTDLGIERIWGGMHYVYICNSAGNTAGLFFNSDGLYGGVAKPSDSPPNHNPNHYGYHFPENDFLNNAKRNFNLMDTLIRTPSGGNMAPSVAYESFIDPETKKYPAYECPSYDQGEWLVQKFNQFMIPNHPTRPRLPLTIIWERTIKMQLFNNVMYTHIPMQPEDPELRRQWLSSEVTYKIRVTRPYMRYISRWYNSPAQRQYTVPADLDHLGYPVYKVSTKELAPTFNDTRVYQTVLDQINIVPNPYYGASLYEGNALETMVKITNLPTGLKNDAPVTINIFTVSGILVRTLTKGDTETSFVNWDLKNFANIPVAGGVYIIHVNCPGIGERMLKFFCTMRPTDLNTF